MPGFFETMVGYSILGVVIGSYFFSSLCQKNYDFKGKLDGKKLSGKAYLQKVVAVLPLAPWNWVRLHFSNGDIVDFFTAKPLGSKSDMRFACNDYIELNGKRIMVAKAACFQGASGTPGAIVAVKENGIDVATGEGVIRIIRLKPENRQEMAVEDFVNGYRIQENHRFGG